MRKTIFTVTACGALLSVGAAPAADPTVKCQQSKLKAQGKLKGCLPKSTSGMLFSKADQSADCQGEFTA